MTNDEILKCNSQYQLNILACENRRTGLISLYKAACLDKNGEQADYIRNQIQANDEIMLDSISQVMSNVTKLKF